VVVESTPGVFKDEGTGVFFVAALAAGAFFVVGGVSGMTAALSFLLFSVVPFFLTVGGVEFLLAGAEVLLEREVLLVRGVGEDTTELRDDRVEGLEEGAGELVSDLKEELLFVAFGFKFFPWACFCLGGLWDKISSADSSLELSRIDPGGNLLRLMLATLDASLKISSSSSSLTARI